MKNWYSITAKGETTAEISIFGPIGNTWDGEGVTAAKFISDFRALKQPDVTISINSPGGSLFDGIAIYTAMASSGKNITAKVMGVAASAASVIAMAASKISMPKNTHMMAHKASWGAWGNADDLSAAVNVLNSLDASIIATYAARTGKPEAEIKALLDNGDVWMSADEAVAAGFADEATELVSATALFDLDTLPENIRNALKPPTPAPAPVAPPATTSLAEQIQAMALAAGMGPLASVFALDPTVVDAGTAQAAIAAAKDIQAFAKLAGQEDKAEPLIRARKTVDEARAVLAANQAVQDESTYVDTAPPATKPTAASGDAFSGSGLWNQIKAMKAGSTK